MNLDQLPPNELLELKTFFKNKKALIIEDKKTARGTIKKSIIFFGVNVSNIETADSIEKATALLENNSFDLVFCNSEIKEKDATHLVDLHTKTNPNRAKVLYILISTPNSLASACKILDSDIDDYIAEPFSATSFNESLYKLTKRKMNKTKGYIEYHNAKACLYKNDLVEAEKSIDYLKEDFDYADEAYFLEGKLYLQHGDLETSLLLFEKALEINHKHYPSLKVLIKGLTELERYGEAYAVTKKLLEHYPINPSQLPELIKLSLLNKKYDDLMNYAKFFHNLEEKCPSIKTTIAASLVLCGKYFFDSGDKTKAIQTLLEAVKASSGKLSIIQNIVLTFMKYDELTIARDVLHKFEPLHGHQVSYQVLEVELHSLNNDTNSVLRKGLPLAQRGIVDKSLYTAVIKGMVKANKKQDIIEELVENAIKHFPKEESLFKSLYKK
jgi:tetratricopeptide (TPR) repeat protein